MATTLLKYYRPPFPLYHPSHSLFYNKIFIRVPVYVRSFRFKFRLRCFSSILTNTSCSELGPLVDDFRHTKEPEKKRQLWLYNTMSKQKELFKPKVPGRVGMYVCGVTAYDLSHIGHARVYVSFDVLFRLSSLCCTSLLVVFGRIFQNVVIVELVWVLKSGKFASIDFCGEIPWGIGFFFFCWYLLAGEGYSDSETYQLVSLHERSLQFFYCKGGPCGLSDYFCHWTIGWIDDNQWMLEDIENLDWISCNFV